MQYAIVGCGPIGRNHARALAADQRISRRFFVDLQEERAAALAAEFGGEPLTSIDALPEGLAAASLTTPPASHFAVTKALLQRGIAVLCEKPLAMTEREAAELVLTSRRSGTPLMVGFKMRYDPIFRRAAELVQRAGPLLSVITTKVQPITGKAEKLAWLARTGAMYELSVHELDLVTAITGLTPRRIRHAALSFRKGWEREDGFSMVIDWGDGVVGSHTAHYAEGIGFQYRDTVLTFIGTEGYVRVERPDRIVVHTTGCEVVEVPESIDSFQAELDELVRLLLDGRPPRVLSADGLEGFVTTSLVETAFRVGGGPTRAGPTSTDASPGGMVPTIDQMQHQVQEATR